MEKSVTVITAGEAGNPQLVQPGDKDRPAHKARINAQSLEAASAQLKRASVCNYRVAIGQTGLKFCAGQIRRAPVGKPVSKPPDGDATTAGDLSPRQARLDERDFRERPCRWPLP